MIAEQTLKAAGPENPGVLCPLAVYIKGSDSFTPETRG